MNLTVEKLCDALSEAFRADQWGDIDPVLFDKIAPDDSTADDARALRSTLQRAVKILNAPGTLLSFAKFFATVKHAGQSYSGLPYTHHLAAVEAVLREFGVDDEEDLAAGWLHDVVEDTGTKLKEIVELFGETVAELVGGVTNEKGENRKIRGMLTYPKIRAGGARTVRLKLADRIANVRAGGNLLDMYKREYEDFRRALYTPGQLEEMWAELDRLLG